MSERTESARQALTEALSRGPSTLRELSQAVGLTEKEVAEHLPHVQKSAKRAKQLFVVDPATCHRCGFTFTDRKRFKTPSRCPSCKSERIHAARFSLAER
jgi:predicted Zn-ribbon and HTH transcriptional regulator